MGGAKSQIFANKPVPNIPLNTINNQKTNKMMETSPLPQRSEKIVSTVNKMQTNDFSNFESTNNQFSINLSN